MTVSGASNMYGEIVTVVSFASDINRCVFDGRLFTSTAALVVVVIIEEFGGCATAQRYQTDDGVSER